MINMEQLNTILKDAIQLHIDRNEMLKDSVYGDFAMSDEKMLKELQEVYVNKLVKTISNVIVGKK